MRKKKINEQIKKGVLKGCVVTGAFLLGWYAHIYVDANVPYSYRTDSPIKDLLGAVGIRDYADDKYMIKEFLIGGARRWQK